MSELMSLQSLTSISSSESELVLVPPGMTGTDVELLLMTEKRSHVFQ